MEGAISGVAVEAVIAAVLTSLMILLFLGSWRSTVIIVTSIPLAILGSIAILSLAGETLNIMTLGGLSASWSTMPRSPSRTSTGTSSRANQSRRRSWTARGRS